MKPFEQYIEDLFMTPTRDRAFTARTLYHSPRVWVIRFIHWGGWPISVSLQRPHRAVQEGRMLFVRVIPFTVLFAWPLEKQAPA